MRARTTLLAILSSAAVTAAVAVPVRTAAADVLSLQVAPTSGPAGSTVTVSGTSNCPGEIITFFFSLPFLFGGDEGEGDPGVAKAAESIGSTTADPGGNFSGPGTIPGDAPLGGSIISARCESGGETGFEDFDVIEQPTTTTTVAPTTTLDTTTTTTTTLASSTTAAPTTQAPRAEQAPITFAG